MMRVSIPFGSGVVILIVAAVAAAGSGGAPLSVSSPSGWAEIWNGIQQSEYPVTLQERRQVVDVVAACSQTPDLRSLLLEDGVRLVLRASGVLAWGWELGSRTSERIGAAEGPSCLGLTNNEGEYGRGDSIERQHVRDKQGSADWYVDADPPDGGDGRSWGTAFDHLQEALAVATAGDEIWVAAGTYLPDYDTVLKTHTGDRSATFRLISGVEIYGGFAGVETLREQRDPETHMTILSGDLDNNDPPGVLPALADAWRLNNSLNVVTGDGTDETAILDGFTITAGHANTWGYYTVGAGVRCNGGSPTLRRCRFEYNCGRYGGGGVYVEDSSPIITGCTFIANVDGAVHCRNGAAPFIEGCTFRGNWATQGGAVYSIGLCLPKLVNCLIVGNHSQMGGGGIYSVSNCSPQLTNCVLTGNSGAGGGAMHNEGSSAPTLINCTIVHNEAQGTAGGILDGNGCASTLTNCVVWGNTGSGSVEENQIYDYNSPSIVRYSCIQDATPNDGSIPFGGTAGFNIDGDPLLANVAAENLRLRPGSPCIDAGQNSAPESVGITTDLAGRDRFFDDPDAIDCQHAPGTCGTAPIVDMGAYERFPTVPPDFDCDGDVDADDFSHFEACVTGPSIVQDSPACVDALLDGDDDIDQADFGIFQGCYSGTGSLADLHCAD